MKSICPQNQMKTNEKKRSSPKIEEFLSSKASEDQKNSKIIQRSDADHSQIIGGGVQMQTIVKLFGGYIPPGFRHPRPKTGGMGDISPQ